MKKMIIGIASQQAIRVRAMAIARGDHRPRPSELKIWFTSMRSLVEIVSDDNRALLRVIGDQKSESLSSSRRRPAARAATSCARSRPWRTADWWRCAIHCATCSR
jgi:predicted transcriptional regulator